MKTTLAILLIAASSGCGVRKFTQHPDGTRTLESRTFLQWGSVNRLTLTDKSLILGGANSGTEIEKLAPLFESAMRGAVAGATK